MSNNSQPDILVTTIDGLGIITVPNNLAHFRFEVKAKSDSLEQAKTQLAEKTNQVMKVLDSFRDKGMKLEGEVDVTSHSYRLEHREGREKMPAGFQAVNTISWSVQVSDLMNDLYKAFLVFDPYMSRPSFSLTNAEAHLKEAFQEAGKNVAEKLNEECSLLNVDPKALKIRDWKFGYDGQLATTTNSTKNFYSNAYGVTGPTGPQGAQGSPGIYGSGPITTQLGSTHQELLDWKLDPGSQTYRIAVRVNYIWSN